MNTEKNKIRTIRKVNFTGKWVEFWFEEDIEIIIGVPDSEYEHLRVDQDKWRESCKGWKLHELADESGLTNDISNHGFVGIITEWEFISPNWNLIKVTERKKKNGS